MPPSEPVLKRRHQIVIDVSFDRPIRLQRALYLMEQAINSSIHKLGRDLTRPGEPEAKMIRCETKRPARVLAAMNIKAREERRQQFEELRKEFEI